MAKKKDKTVAYCAEYLQSLLPNLADAGKAVKRKFIIHVGPTNSGKTYDAIQALKAAGGGVYLGPLRLLALEVFDNLNADGCPCSLLTGEELVEVPSASFTASTVEMCNYERLYNVAVIDECQMIGDPARGGQWLKAICLVRAETVHLCAAPEAVGLIQRLMGDLDAEYRVVEHRRLAPLEFSGVLKDIEAAQPGDAFITFSRKGVLGIAAALERVGVKASVIYGALPPQARREEVRRFTCGETSVVVATDAIGMGVSLPIRRVIFCQTEKYDGTSNRDLTTTEILQIAGRAGRYGIYDVGYVMTMNGSTIVPKALKSAPNQLKKIPVIFPVEALDSPYSLEVLFEAWRRIPETKTTRKVDLSDASLLYERLKPILSNGASKRTAYSFVSCPVNPSAYALVEYWLSCCRALLAGNPVPAPSFPDSTLSDCEQLYQALDIQHQMARRGGCEIDNSAEKARVCEKINGFLKADKAGFLRKCSSCGQPLPVTSPYGMCESCYECRDTYVYEYCDEDWAVDTSYCHLNKGTWNWSPRHPAKRGPYPDIGEDIAPDLAKELRSDQIRDDLLWYAAICEEYVFRSVILEAAEEIRAGVPIFSWRHDGCPWDSSGELKDTGRVLSPDDSWKDFLGCYTGAWVATYQSGCGKRFQQYGEDMEETIDEIRTELALQVVNAYCARYGDSLYPGVQRLKYGGEEYCAGDVAEELDVFDVAFSLFQDLPVTNINIPLSEVLRIAEEFEKQPLACPEFSFADGWTPPDNVPEPTRDGDAPASPNQKP